MNKNYKVVELGTDSEGKPVLQGLKFNLGTLKHIGEITKEDPLDFSGSFDNMTQIFRFVHTIVYAGLLSNADSKEKEPDFTAKDVERWINDWDLEKAMEVINAFNESYRLSGEESNNTQGQAA